MWLGERRFSRLLVADSYVEQHVARMLRPDLGGALLYRMDNPDHGGQRRPVDLDGLDRVAGLIDGVRNHEGAGVADVAHHAVGENRIGRAGERIDFQIEQAGQPAEIPDVVRRPERKNQPGRDQELDDETGLEPGGRLCIWVPAYELLYSRFDAKLGHVRRYRKRQLESDIRLAGYEVVERRVTEDGVEPVAAALGDLTEGFSCVLAVNRVYAPESQRLEPGAELALLPPVSGGAGPGSGFDGKDFSVRWYRELELPGGDRIVAIITHGSTAELGLAVGSDAVAMVKASWVLLGAGDSAQKLSARNQLRGMVQKIVSGAVNAEVTVELPGGTVVTAIVTNSSVDSLGLAVGKPAAVLFKACLLYTSDAADDLLCVDLGGRRTIKKKNTN